jgi:hypothetical protein
MYIPPPPPPIIPASALISGIPPVVIAVATIEIDIVQSIAFTVNIYIGVALSKATYLPTNPGNYRCSSHGCDSYKYDSYKCDSYLHHLPSCP